MMRKANFGIALVLGLALACGGTIGINAHAQNVNHNTPEVNTVRPANNNLAKYRSSAVTSASQPQNNPVKYNRMSHVNKANYDTRIAYTRRHHRGYAIYAHGPYKTSAQSMKPIAYQRQLRHSVIHVIKTAKVGKSNWINFKSNYLKKTLNGWMNYNGTDKSTRWFYVPLISQRPQLPTGCEITATTMMLKHVVGRKVNKMKLAREMPRSSNPNRGFVGSPYSASGWYIYPNGLRGIVNRYTHHHAWNMTGDSNNMIKKQINKNRPVVIWMADIDGFVNHALTIYGYDENHLFMNDPWRDERRSLSLPYINAHRSWDAWRALSYY